MNNQPIGIFDSGIGGLTVASAINKIMPHETIVYFGDTAHTPWGNQSSQAIAQYCAQITDVLLAHNCKIIVIACNTASSSAVPTVENKVIGLNVPIINVIDPITEYISKHYAHKKIGVIGTKRTIKSDEYAKRIHAHNNSVKVISKATPLLAPLIEENYINSLALNLILNDYLLDPVFDNINALILGCTHYPLIKEHIMQFFQDKIRNVEVIDSADIVALQVQNLLTSQQLNCDINTNPIHKFLVSHDHSFFNDTAKKFFQGEITLETY
jgi:glutamate racemase